MEDYKKLREIAASSPQPWPALVDLLDEVEKWRTSAENLYRDLLAVSAARREACDSLMELIQTTSQYGDYTTDPAYVRAAELKKA